MAHLNLGAIPAMIEARSVIDEVLSALRAGWKHSPGAICDRRCQHALKESISRVNADLVAD